MAEQADEMANICKDLLKKEGVGEDVDYEKYFNEAMECALKYSAKVFNALKEAEGRGN